MRASLIALLVLLAGCDAGPTTLVVQVRTDLQPGREMTTVRVTVEPAGGGDPVVRDTDALAEADSASWGAGIRVAELAALPPGSTRLVVAALDAAGEVLVERPARVELAGGVSVVTVLLTRDCVSVVCPDPGGDPTLTACVAGRCVAEECTEESTAGCGEPECTTDADCPGAFDCAVPRCLPSGVCFAEPDPGLCGPGESCRADEGCIPATCRGACELVLVQCGCGEGEGCYTTTGSDRVCQAAGALGEGASCASDFECAPGHTCLGRTGEQPFACRRFCSGPSDCGIPRKCTEIGIAGLQVCLGIGCDAVADTGCPAGETCAHALPGPFGEALTECRAVGAGAAGSACAEPTDCGPGLLCDGVLDESPTCRGYCRTDADCGEGVCAELPRLAGTGLGVCDAGCDPVSGDGCATGTCRIRGTNDVVGVAAGVTICAPVGSTPPGGACTGDESCVAGTLCGGTPARCSRLCVVGGPGCVTGTCMALDPPTELGSRTIGLCL